MNEIILGCTDIKVTELCFGALPMGPAQKNMSVDECTQVIVDALHKGINFIDTAQSYRTYEPIRNAMKLTGIHPVIATKSTTVSYEDMENAVHEALKSLDVEYIDIFLLHAARAEVNIFDVRSETLRCLTEYKRKGLIRAVGISTHSVDIVNKAAENSEIDIIFPILNKIGMGILNGNLHDMETAINKCYDNGKGVYIMKALAGGNLIDDYVNAMEYVQKFSSGRMPIAVGMVSTDEVDMNVNFFNGVDINITANTLVKSSKKFIIVPSLCKSCGACIDICHTRAVIMTNDGAVINNDICLQCGYCVTVCPQFAIRMI